MEFAAHIRKTDDKIQTVAEHCEGAAVLAEKYAKKMSLTSLARLQSLLHDVGKLTVDFNGYIREENNYQRGQLDHSFAGAKYLCALAQKFGDAEIIDTAHFIARTIISHHGMHDWIKEDGGDYFSERVSENKRYDEICRNIKDIVDEKEISGLLECASREYVEVRNNILSISKAGNTNENRLTLLAFYLGMFERLSQSMLIDADRTDTADFMSDCKTEKEFNTAILWEDMHIRMEEKLKSFANRTDKISVRRRSISERCARFADHRVGVCRLIVPTGGGKTLSSLRFAIEYCRRYKMEKIIYVAPFMSILEQNSDEICRIAGKENFLEHYSDVLNSIDDKEELNDYELRTEKWDTPVIATTMVQFFNTLFSGKSSAVRRMHRLCKAVIIIDEVQSVPLKCVHLFDLAVNFLSKICGSTVVLCSATQPVFENTEYPLLLDENESMTGDFSEDFDVFKRTELVPKILKSGYTYDQAAQFCYEKYLECGSLLAVVNTKSSAAAVYENIISINKQAEESEKAEIVHLSTNMCPQHRREVIGRVRKLLKEKKRIICVTTQLIEAGVDISFGCVVRSLAGMDNAAQAAGRCNRNGENDVVCPVYIINIRDEKLGNLNEIKSAQSISGLIIGSGKYPDLLNVDAMSLYFAKLYKEYEKELSFSVSDGGVFDTLVGLLSLDKNRQNINKDPQTMLCAQAFKTAGRLFAVIEENTEQMIVPYNEEADEIILRLNSDITPQESAELLRKAQKYIVGIYKGMKKALEKSGAVYQLKCGALALRKEYHDPEMGVTVEGSEMQPLIY